MKILALIPNKSGVDYHRLYKPLMRMQIDNPDLEISLGEDRNATPDLTPYDLVLFSRFLEGSPYSRSQGYDLHYGTIQKLAELKIPYIIDVDDFWKLPKFHYNNKNYRALGCEAAIKDAIRYAAGVTVTTELLASEVRRLNHNVSIIPNALEWTDAQWYGEVKKSDKIRFGWVGGIGHENDLNLIVDAVNFIQDKYDVEFHLCGIRYNEPIWKRIMDKFPRAIIHEAMPVNEYGLMYSNFDVMLSPLESNKFNSMKSELKVLEAAEYKLPIIASDTAPYNTMPTNLGVTLVSNSPSDWINAMQLYIYSKTRQPNDGQYNFDYCHQFFNIEQINAKRLQFYERICKQHTKDLQ